MAPDPSSNPSDGARPRQVPEEPLSPPPHRHGDAPGGLRHGESGGVPPGTPARARPQLFTGLFLGAGVFAAAGMMVPGLSGAILQALIGSYATYVTALRELNVPVLLVFHHGQRISSAATSWEWRGPVTPPDGTRGRYRSTRRGAGGVGPRRRASGRGPCLGQRRATREVARLPERIRALEDANPPYEVVVSNELENYTEAVTRRVAETAAAQEVS